MEFTLLSRLVGDPTYENLARRAVRALWDKRHPVTGLVGEFRVERDEGAVGRRGSNSDSCVSVAVYHCPY